MERLPRVTDAGAFIVDTSAVINLVATGSAPAIVAALPNRMLIVDVVLSELEGGRTRGHDTHDRLAELLNEGVFQVVELGVEGMPGFQDLVIGAAAATLGDGEAATIAYAVAHRGTALIDERKATRICRERYPQLRVACTLDVLLHEEVQRQLGRDLISGAVFQALRDARMSVAPHYLELVVGLIGDDRAALCPSLPRRRQ